MKRFALILLAGDSTRFHSETPKQFYLVNDKPLIYYTIKSFQDAKNIDGILLVSKEEYINKVKDIIVKYNLTKVKGICVGGNSRQESVYNGLNMLSEVLSPNDIVFIHDGARPLVKEELIDSLINSLDTYQGATAAISSKDTIAMVDNAHMEMVGVLDRSQVYRIQTPQAFHFGIIKEAHEMYKGKNVTDDSQLLQGVFPIKIVLGDDSLVKITTMEDIKYLKVLLEE